MYWIKEEAWNKPHPIQWILWSLLEWEPLSSRKGGHFSCLLFANSLLIGSLILHADVFLFLSAWKILKNSSLHLEIKKFHLEIQISQSRNSGDLTHWATWLAWLELVVCILGTHRIAVSILLHRPAAHTLSSMHTHPVHFAHLDCSCPITSWVRPACPES